MSKKKIGQVARTILGVADAASTLAGAFNSGTKTNLKGAEGKAPKVKSAVKPVSNTYNKPHVPGKMYNPTQIG